MRWVAPNWPGGVSEFILFRGGNTHLSGGDINIQNNACYFLAYGTVL